MGAVFHLNELGDDFIEAELSNATYRFSPLTLGGRSRIQAVLRKSAENPMDLYKEAARDATPQVAAAIFDKAVHRRAFWPPAIDSEEGVNLILSHINLQAAVVQEMLKKNHPEITFDSALQLVEQISPAAFATLATFAWTGRRPDDPNLAAGQAGQSTGTS